MNLTDIFEHFEEVRDRTRSDAVKLEDVLSATKGKLEDANSAINERIKDLSASLTTTINGAEINTRIQATALYKRFKEVVIDFPELIDSPETDSPDDLSALIQAKITLLGPLVQAIIADEDKSGRATGLIQEMVPIGVIPPTDEEGNELQFESELDLRKHQLDRLRPKMAALRDVFSGEGPNTTSGNTGLLDTLIGKTDGLAALASENPADTYRAGTLFVAGKKFTIGPAEGLADHNPTVTYDLGEGSAPVVGLKDHKLTLQLGTADHPTTVAQLKTGLEAQEGIDTVVIEEAAADHLLVQAAPEGSISSYSHWVTSKANALNNELDDAEIPLGLPPQVKNIWDQLQGKSEGQGDDELTSAAIINLVADQLKEWAPDKYGDLIDRLRDVILRFLESAESTDIDEESPESTAVNLVADKLKEWLPDSYGSLIDKLRDIILDFLGSEESSQNTAIDIVAGELTAIFPDHASIISFWRDLLKDVLGIDRSDNLIVQLIAIIDGDTFTGRSFEVLGFDLLNLIRNVLYLLKFLDENNIGLSLEDYPAASQPSEAQGGTASVLSSIQDASTVPDPLSAPSDGSTQAPSSGTSTSEGGDPARSGTRTSLDLSGLSEAQVRAYIESVLPELPAALQPLATRLKDGKLLIEQIKGHLSADTLENEWEVKSRPFLSIFRDEAGDYLFPSLGTITDELVLFLAEYLRFLLEHLLGGQGPEDQGLVQELVNILCQLPQLLIDLILHHIPLPDWLEDFLVGEPEDDDQEVANPVLLLLVMPYSLVRELFEAAKTELQKRQPA